MPFVDTLRMTVSDSIQQRKESLVRNGVSPQKNGFSVIFVDPFLFDRLGSRVEQRAYEVRLGRKEVETYGG